MGARRKSEGGVVLVAYVVGWLGTIAAEVTFLALSWRVGPHVLRRGRLLGAALGAAGTAVVVIPTSAIDPTMFVPAVLGGGVVGSCLGAAVAGSRRRPVRGATRTARLVPVTVAHYVPPLERTAPVAAAGAVTVVFFVIVALGANVIRMQPALPTLLAPGALVLATLASLVGCRAASAAVLRQPQPAGDEGELRRDDATRAAVLRSLCAVPVAFAAAAQVGVVTTTVYAVADTATFPPQLLVLALPGVLLLVAVVAFLQVGYAARVRAGSHYLRSLWSATA